MSFTIYSGVGQKALVWLLIILIIGTMGASRSSWVLWIQWVVLVIWVTFLYMCGKLQYFKQASLVLMADSLFDAYRYHV